MTKKTQITGQISNTSVKITGKIENKTKIQGSLREGARGYSAYDVWLRAGNEGTVQDFLESLAGEDKFYRHNQNISSQEWTVIHNLNKKPSVTIVDSADTVVYGEITYVNENELKINFSAGFSGKAYLN